MDLITFYPESTGAEALRTEILYAVASAKTKGNELILLSPKNALPKTVVSELKKIKKSGKIDLFVSFSDFEEESTESRYILNKYPGLSLPEQRDNRLFLIKVQ